MQYAVNSSEVSAPVALLKHEITLAKNLLRKESKLPISFEQFF